MLEALVYAALMFAVGRVKVVLDAVVTASWEFFRNICPLVSKLLVQVEDLLLLLLVDRVLLDVGVQMIMPPAE